jgi:hypothetical protein
LKRKANEERKERKKGRKTREIVKKKNGEKTRPDQTRLEESFFYFLPFPPHFYGALN